MQGTTAFHDAITDPLLPQADPVRHEAAALDAPVDRLDLQPTRVQCLMRPWLLQERLLAAGLLGWPADLDVGQRERQQAQVLPQSAPGG
jgi:hypothetical protein